MSTFHLGPRFNEWIGAAAQKDTTRASYEFVPHIARNFLGSIKAADLLQSSPRLAADEPGSAKSYRLRGIGSAGVSQLFQDIATKKRKRTRRRCNPPRWNKLRSRVSAFR